MKCILCEQKINDKKELWVRVTNFNKENEVDEVFYHKKCHKEYHREKFQQEYYRKMKFVTPLLKKLLGGKETYEIQ